MDYGHSLIIGNTLSGKSYLCNWLITKYFNNMYDLILLISGTYDSINGDIYTSIPSTRKTKRLDNKTLNFIKTYIEKYPTKKILLILDDMNKMLSKTGTKKENDLARECESNLTYLFGEGRHDNLYTIALVQYYKQLKPIIRSNARYQIITFAGSSICEKLYENVDNCFENVNELKNFVKQVNVEYKTVNGKKYYQCIMFDCFNKSRKISDCVTILKP
jgi:hypothetical protein